MRARLTPVAIVARCVARSAGARAAQLNPSDPPRLIDLGEAFADGSRFMSEALTLAACDLGYDPGAPCGRHSDVLRRNCALAGTAAYPDCETRLFGAHHGAGEREVIQAHRAELLRRIRAGQVAGLFDPVPLPPKP